jgi:predicted DNA-binding transcriptional regulator YafY
LTSEPFDVVASPDTPNQLANAWTVSDGDLAHVRLRFHDATAARRALENRWHPSQREETMKDGTVELSFEVAGLLEITPWILTWGDTAEVLEPVELRQRLTTIALGMAQRYAPKLSRPRGNTQLSRRSLVDSSR